MKAAVALVFSFFLVCAGLSCNREESAPPSEKAAVASPKTETASTEDQKSACIRNEPAPPSKKAATASSKTDTTSTESPQSAAASTLWVASVTDSGFLPFAMYRAGKWSKPWPKSRNMSSQEYAAWKETMEKIKKGEKVEEIAPNRRALKDIPPEWFGGNAIPDTWHGLSVATGKRFTVHTPWALEVGGVDDPFRWVLDFDQVTPSGIFDGIVLSRNLQMAESVVTVAENSPEWNNIMTCLTAIFNQEEDKAIKEGLAPEAVQGELDPRERRKAELKLRVERIPSGQSGQPLYHFEMSRKYKGYLINISKLTGWLLNIGDGKFSLISKDFVQDDADGTKITSSTPQALLQWDGRTFLFLSDSGYEWSGVSIMEWDGSHLVLRASETLDSR